MRRTGILFVCFGNICRSPMAEAVLRHRLAERGAEERFAVASRGTTAIHAGKPADPRAVAVLRSAGIEVGSHVARQIEDADFAAFEWIIALDPSILRTLRGWVPADFGGRLELLTRLAPLAHGAGVADPWHAGPEAFAEALRDIDAAVEGLLQRLQPP
jgi:protein-tyrosine phosphatase